METTCGPYGLWWARERGADGITYESGGLTEREAIYRLGLKIREAEEGDRGDEVEPQDEN